MQIYLGSGDKPIYKFIWLTSQANKQIYLGSCDKPKYKFI